MLSEVLAEQDTKICTDSKLNKKTAIVVRECTLDFLTSLPTALKITAETVEKP